MYWNLGQYTHDVYRVHCLCSVDSPASCCVAEEEDGEIVDKTELRGEE